MCAMLVITNVYTHPEDLQPCHLTKKKITLMSSPSKACLCYDSLFCIDVFISVYLSAPLCVHICVDMMTYIYVDMMTYIHVDMMTYIHVDMMIYIHMHVFHCTHVLI